MKLESLKSSKFEAMNQNQMKMVKGGGNTVCVFTWTKTSASTDGGKTWITNDHGDKHWYEETLNKNGVVVKSVDCGVTYS